MKQSRMTRTLEAFGTSKIRSGSSASSGLNHAPTPPCRSHGPPQRENFQKCLNFRQVDFLNAHQVADGVAGTCANFVPVSHALNIQLND